MIMEVQSYSNMIEVCRVLADENDLKVTIEESGKGALLAAFGAFAGGVLGGPVGLGVGGTLGSLVGMQYTRGKYKSVVTIINNMTPAQHRKLAVAVQNCFSSVTAADVAGLLALLATNQSLKELVIKEIGSFMYKEMNRLMV